MTEFQEEWVCPLCGSDMGEHPRGIEVNCPKCGNRIILPGFDNKEYTAAQLKFIAESSKRARRQTQESYKAMREH